MIAALFRYIVNAISPPPVTSDDMPIEDYYMNSTKQLTEDK